MHKNLSNYAEKGGSNVCEPPFKVIDLLNVSLPFEHRKGVRWDLDSGDRAATESCYSTGGEENQAEDSEEDCGMDLGNGCFARCLHNR
jgi:hypothetical protein